MADNTAPVTVTPGWKTSEFWLSLVAALVGAVMASGIIPTGSVWVQVVGIVATILGALGYQVSRTSVKTSAHDAIEAIHTAAISAAVPPAGSPADALKDAGAK